jgi:hypothetical protein
MNFKKTRAFFNKIRGKKTATGLPINSQGKTPNGTAVNGVNKNGRPVTTKNQGRTPKGTAAMNTNQSRLNSGNWEIGSNGKVVPRMQIT